MPFATGETLTYDVSWSSYLTAGTVTMSVKEKRSSGSSPAYYIAAEVKPSGLMASLYTLYYKADTVLDAVSLLPQRGSLYSQEGSRRRTKVTQFNHSTGRADFELVTGTTMRRSLALPRYSQDALSAVYVLRALSLAPNIRMTMPVCDGGNNYKVTLAVGGIEPVKTAAGRRDAYRITPTIVDEKGQRVGRPVTIWLSSDAKHVPVQVRADLSVGSVVLVLHDAG